MPWRKRENPSHTLPVLTLHTHRTLTRDDGQNGSEQYDRTCAPDSEQRAQGRELLHGQSVVQVSLFQVRYFASVTTIGNNNNTTHYFHTRFSMFQPGTVFNTTAIEMYHVCRYISIENKDAAIKTLYEGVIVLLDKHQVTTNCIIKNNVIKHDVSCVLEQHRY